MSDQNLDGTVTWGELLEETRGRLLSGGIDQVDVNARRIVEEASGMDGAELSIGLNELATVRGVSSLDSMVARRLAGEPLQYVLGRWSFRTLDLAVDRRVLIPRPETEEVAGWALTEFDRIGNPALPVVDMGTGSGAIGLSFLVERPGSTVWLTDRSADALTVARANLTGLGRAAVNGRVAEGSWFDALPKELERSIGVIVSNPPYVAPDDELPAEVRDWEPTDALIAPDDGLADLVQLVEQAPRWLDRQGALVLELAPGQAETVATLARRGFAETAVHTDMSGRERAVVARSPKV